MSRTPSRITQADVARAIRAAQQTGAGSVEITPDGTIKINLSPSSTDPERRQAVAPTKVIVL
jgi:hypothetical protein